MDVCVMFVS